MKSISLILLSLAFSPLVKANCIPAHEYVPFDGVAAQPNANGSVALGTYARISPDGRYVLRSFSGDHLSRVTLMELKSNDKGQKVARAIETAFDNEAFPVQGSWRFLVDTDGSHHRVSDIVNQGKKSKKQFSGGVQGFYTTAAEMAGNGTNEITIRSLSWPNNSRDVGQQGTGELFNKIVTIKKNPNGSYEKIKEEGAFYLCHNLRKTEGTVYSLPMISSDGTEFAAMPQNPSVGKPSIKIYKFGANNKDCEVVEDLQVPTAKVIFGPPQKGKKAPLVFLSSSFQGNQPVTGIHLYDRDLKKMFYVGDPEKAVNPDSFPGMTKDGRVIYGATWKSCESGTCKEKTGYVIADPYQSQDMQNFREVSPQLAKNLKKCITEEEVKAVEREQEALYGFTKESAPKSEAGTR